MDDPVRSNWSLNREAFDRLLAALDDDRAAAGEAYECLRRKLVHYFAWQLQRDPEALADEALNRIARKIGEGAQIENYRQYAFGVARLLLLENRRSEIRERVAVEASRQFGAASTERPAACLEQCLQSLSPENRELILAYYQGEKRDRIEARTALAEKYGVQLNALRNRALRVRMRLEQCMERCMHGDESVNPATNNRGKS